ncbi:hypothetical protein DPMN_088753 [Dreissena polymorpha]|uniref:Uncharacterized protein n=1 Tax=Dreissena polymorpha TaxID=45954 RepID=A0A9D4QXJ6_DREPO|nr:hypothetical protein DPMN_088713 [Dreissena polymorpha]KAH3846452.1 hypothetical protein DPMN_088753 [Dreissena polymorpha]
MIRGPCAFHALFADLESIRATLCVRAAASSCSCPESNSNSQEVNRFCTEQVHLHSLIPGMVMLYLCCLPGLVNGSDMPCTSSGCGPCRDDGFRPDGC